MLYVSYFWDMTGSTSHPCRCPSVSQSKHAKPHPDITCNDDEVVVTLEPYVRVSDPDMIDKDRTPRDNTCVCLCVGSLQSLTDHFQATD